MATSDRFLSLSSCLYRTKYVLANDTTVARTLVVRVISIGELKAVAAKNVIAAFTGIANNIAATRCSQHLCIRDTEWVMVSLGLGYMAKNIATEAAYTYALIIVCLYTR